MQAFMKNNKGMTMIELLVAFALLSLVLLLIGNVHLSGQKQYTDQTKQISDQANVRLAAKVMTQDIRSASPTTVSVDNGVLIIDDIQYKYNSAEQAIYKDDSPFVTNIKEFVPTKRGDKITLKMISTTVPNQKDHSASLTTDIYLRK